MSTTNDSAAGASRIGIDWGTTHVRAWLLDAGGSALETRTDDRGMGRLAGDPAAFAAAADELLQGWPRLPTVACGMVGAKQGWVEAPYVTVPCALDRLADRAVRATSGAGRRIAILPGLAQDDPADVMRGEETKLVGLALAEPDWAAEGTAVLPGTHAKHVTMAGGRVVRFRSVPTGELFEVLARHSILRLSLDDGEGWDEAAFAAAVTEGAGLSAGGLGAALFNLRARSLLTGATPSRTRARLSGLLIGAELGFLEPTRPLVLVGSGALSGPYERALGVLERDFRLCEGAALVRRALAHLAPLILEP